MCGICVFSRSFFVENSSITRLCFVDDSSKIRF